MSGTHPPPRVSVVVPTYDNARFLGTAIDSVLAQRFADLELIVIDDGSSDDTEARVSAYRDPRLRYVRHTQRLGIAGSRNHGLHLARGEYTAALDSDDYAEPHRLGRQIAFLDRHPACAAVGSWARWMDAQGNALGGITRRPTRAADVHAQLLFKSAVQQPSATGRTAILRRLGYDESFVYSSDYEFWTRLAIRHPIANQPQALVRCRRHATSTTRGKSALIQGFQRRIFAAQLDRLDMRYDAADLERHRLLWRPGKSASTQLTPSPGWAADWIERLSQANRRRGIYDAAAFDAVLGTAWLQALRGAAWQDVPRLLRLTAGLPLRRYVLAGVTRQLRLQARHPGARRLRPVAGR